MTEGMTDRRLLQRTIASGAAQLSHGLRGVFPILVARLSGAAVLGLTSWAWSWVDLLSKLAVWGLDQATTIAVAEASARAPHGRAWLLRCALQRAALRAVVIALVVSGGAFLVGGEAPMAIGVLVWALPFVAVFRIANAASWGAGKLHHGLLSKGITESGVTIVAFVLLAQFGQGARAPLLAIIAGYLASSIVAHRLTVRELASTPASVAGASGPPAALARARAIGLTDLLYMGSMRLDMLILGAFAARGAGGISLEALGAYAAAVEIGFVVKKVRSIFEPIFLRDLAADGAAHAQQVRRLQIAAQLAVGGGLWLAMPAVLAVFGSEFAVAVPWARVLLLANFANGLLSTDSAMNVLEPAVNTRVAGVGLICSGVAAILLIPVLGPLGAAAATTLGFTVQAAMRLATLQRRGLPLEWSLHRGHVYRALALLLLLSAPALAVPLPAPAAGALGLLYSGVYLAWTIRTARPRTRRSFGDWGSR